MEESYIKTRAIIGGDVSSCIMILMQQLTQDIVLGGIKIPVVDSVFGKKAGFTAVFQYHFNPSDPYITLIVHPTKQ